MSRTQSIYDYLPKAVVNCQYCGQFGAVSHPCRSCGGPIISEPVDGQPTDRASYDSYSPFAGGVMGVNERIDYTQTTMSGLHEFELPIEADVPDLLERVEPMSEAKYFESWYHRVHKRFRSAFR